MANIELSPEENELLERIVRSYLSELRMEIADTDQSSFKEGLRKEQDMLNGLIEKLESAAK